MWSWLAATQEARRGQTTSVCWLRVLITENALGAHVQLVVNIGSVLQQGVHRLGVSILGGDGESRAAILQGSRQQM